MKRFLKAITRLTPIWFFNFLVTTSRKKKVACGNSFELEKFNPDVGSDCFANNKLVEPEFDLLIIIPCYNAEKYIKQCVESIEKQSTSYKICIRLINDGSTDKTKELLEEFVYNKSSNFNYEIINKANSGAAATRNAGLKSINARYIMFMDSDDHLVGNDVFQFAISSADSIECNSKIIEFNHSNNIDKGKTSGKIKQCKYRDLSGFPWGKIYSSSIFEKVCFPEGYWFEDTVDSFIIYPQAKGVYKCSKTIYCYVDNQFGSTSISKNNNKTIDTIYVTRRLVENRKQYPLDNNEEYGYRIANQVICNCGRLSQLSDEIQVAVFVETQKLFKDNNFLRIKRFGKLYKAIENNDFGTYFSFCKLYTKMYIS